MDRGAWQATVHGIAKSQTQLCNWAHAHVNILYVCISYPLLCNKLYPKLVIKIINTRYLIVSIGQELGRSLRSRWRLELELKDTLLRLQSLPPHMGGARGWLTVTVSQLLHRVQLFAISWTAAHQAPLSSPISRSSLRLMSTKSVMPSNHLILCSPFSCPQSFPAPGSFLMSQFFASSGRSIGASASASVPSMNI